VDVERNARLVFEILEDFFPERARHLAGYITESSARSKALDPWLWQQLVKFIWLLSRSVEDLKRGYLEKRIMTMAWAARNILELSVWIDYCNASNTNARQFEVDAARDLDGFGKNMQRLEVLERGAKHPDLIQMQKELAEFAKTQYGVSTLDDDFTRVSDAAKSLGVDRFEPMNKLYSKFAHPTALALNSVDAEEADAGLRLMFLEDGAETSTDSLTKIRNFALIHLPLPGIAATP